MTPRTPRPRRGNPTVAEAQEEHAQSSSPRYRGCRSTVVAAQLSCSTCSRSSPRPASRRSIKLSRRPAPTGFCNSCAVSFSHSYSVRETITTCSRPLTTASGPPRRGLATPNKSWSSPPTSESLFAEPYGSFSGSPGRADDDHVMDVIDDVLLEGPASSSRRGPAARGSHRRDWGWLRVMSMHELVALVAGDGYTYR